MSDDVQVQVEGAVEFGHDMVRLGERIDRDGTLALERAAQALVPVVRSRMPVDSGALSASVAASVDMAAHAADVTASTPYAGWIEFGGTRGRPYIDTGRYMTPVVRDAGARYGAALEQSMTSTIRGFPWTHTKR
jgi:hypothetical protein